MAGRARQAEKTAGAGGAQAAGTQTEEGTSPTGTSTGQKPSETEQVRPDQPGEGRFEGRRAATVNLPFVTAQFRAPDLHAPKREDLEAAARGARSMLPSGRSLLFMGGLAVTAVAGVIEWPVAAAIGIGSALASRGKVDVAPRGPEQPVRAEVADTSGANGGETSGTS
ncbi:hypothetical protein GCM10023215_34300 [Pseudonocardia yuanmonensis]|uniref:Uncharacterized protein n=1 Tax=Pseudonocardia yuanmonensis TaxID=1095914 RepID=A0ABP8WQV4_9PSEU